MSEEWYAHEREDEVRDPRDARPLCTYRPPVDPDGWAPMRDYLEGRALSYPLARENGWYPTYMSAWAEAPAHWRMVIPCQSLNPKNLFYQSRTLGVDRQGQATSGERRYDSPHGVTPLDAMPRVQGREHMHTLVLTEGPMDALAAAGVRPGIMGVSLMGTLLTEPKIAQLQTWLARTYDHPRIVLCPDNDDAGRRALPCLMKPLMNLGCPVSVVFPSSGYKDLASMPPRERAFTLWDAVSSQAED